MTVGYQKSNGADLDSVFEPKLAGDPTADATGYQDNTGADLNQKYAPASKGGIVSIDTGYQDSSGTDLRHIFCGKGLRLEVSLSKTDGFCSTGAGNFCNAVGDASASASGGRSPYTYEWQVISGPASVQSPNAADTTVSHNAQAPSSHSTTLRCTATDADGKTISGDINWGCEHA